MDNKKDCFINVIALSETFIENNKSKLKDKNELVIDLVNLDESVTEKKIDKNKLSEELVNIFSSNVESLKEININYLEKGIKVYLTGINIFK